jgi:8-oxo-dGTP pyrophosphatase MutT (NUDIX family)
MMLADRLRAALAEGGRREIVLLGSDLRDAIVRPDQTVMPAAVLVPITDRPDPGILLTVRSSELRRHGGQVAFPGGRIDPEDDGPVAAALREAEEEIGLPRELVDIVGVADGYRTITGFEVTPIIGVVPPDLTLVPHIAEVATIFEVPLSFLLEPANHIEKAMKWQGGERRYFEMEWEGFRIWGATAAMIVNLGRRLAFPG